MLRHKKMCNKAVRRKSYTLKYVPDFLVCDTTTNENMG